MQFTEKIFIKFSTLNTEYLKKMLYKLDMLKIDFNFFQKIFYHLYLFLKSQKITRRCIDRKIELM